MQIHGTPQELLALVRSIMNPAPGSTEEDRDERIKKLESMVDHPAAMNLIYYSDPPLTPEEVVKQIIEYRAIEL